MDILATYEGKYTVELRTLLNDPLIKPKIDTALSTYPLYEKKSEEKYIPSMVPTRDQLNTKLLNYYKYREIGFETVGRFIDELEISMNEIMPYYNQLFYAADQDYDILYNVDYTKEITTNKNEENKNNINESDSTTSNTNETVSSSNNFNETDSNTGKVTESGTSSSTGENTSTASDETTTSATVNKYNKSVKSGTPQDSLSISNMGIDTVNYADELGFNHETNSENGTSSGSSSSEATSSLSGTSSNETNTTNSNKIESISSGSETRESIASGTNTNTITSTGTNQAEETVIERTNGNYGAMSTQRQVQEYIDIIRNIEQEIINDPRIQELFMLIY